MNNTDLIHLIKHFMRNEHKAVEEVIDSPLSEVANLIKVLQSCQGKVVFIGVGKSGIIARIPQRSVCRSAGRRAGRIRLWLRRTRHL